MSTQAQIDANRANAQFSTGPTSTAGKATVSLNAVKTGLTGRAILLHTEEATQYEALMLAYQKLYKPVGPEEASLVQSIVDTAWRIDRIPALETSLINLGHAELLKRSPDEANNNLAMIEMQVRLMYDKQFRNLQIQEARLVRRRDTETAELRRLQKERKVKEAASLNKAATACLLARHRKQPFDLAAIGFEFSTEQLESHLATLSRGRKQELLAEALKGDTHTSQAAA